MIHHAVGFMPSSCPLISYPMPYVLMLHIPTLFRYGRYVRYVTHNDLHSVMLFIFFPLFFFGGGNDCVLDGRVVQ
jgi:hypothetical protein